MSHITEIDSYNGSAIIVTQQKTAFFERLEKALREYNLSVLFTQEIPSRHTTREYIFLHVDNSQLSALRHLKNARMLMITESFEIFEKIRQELEKGEFKHAKVVRIDHTDAQSEDVEKTLWFLLTPTTEKGLNIAGYLPKLPPQKATKRKLAFRFTRRRIIAASIFVILTLHTAFLFPLGITTYHLYQAGKALQNKSYPRTDSELAQAQLSLNVTHSLYVLAKPGFNFLFIASLPENIIGIHDEALTAIRSARVLTEDMQSLFSDIIQPTHSQEDIHMTVDRIRANLALLSQSTQNLSDQLNYPIPAIQKLKKQSAKAAEYSSTAQTIAQHLPSLLAENSTKHYSVFFYNNMEIRPGGGFLGSFADVVFQNYALKTFQVYDVYDADGQLKTHIRPPSPIRDVLQQPHWFLRDSNFSPDFPENIKSAEFFLSEELGLSKFDGSIGITTTALTYILDAYKDLYIPDFKETVTADNFYLKAQEQSDINFFPGSTAKKSFLSTVGRTMMLNADKASPVILGQNLKHALDEKHLVIHMTDAAVQKDIDALGWGGNVLTPQCVRPNVHCIINHILPVEANLGVNKANYFVSKLMKLTTTMKQDGHIENEFSVAFTNNAAEGVFPGGAYTNYFQVYLPFDAHIESVGLDSQGSNHDYDISQSGPFKIVGQLLKIKPQETRIITISYSLATPIQRGENVYQVVLQKQIGAFNSDFQYELRLPDNSLLTSQNFKSVAKNHTFQYNSSLSTNKVFVTEFIQQ